MFGFFEKKQQGKKIMFHVFGLHCASCAMKIDSALEDMIGVFESKTHYAKAKTEVTFDPHKVKENVLRKTIQELGYIVST